MSSALKLRHLTVNYERSPVLWDVSLEIPEGAMVGVIGPNGAGKSTLLKTCLGLLAPVSGNVSFFGKPFKKVQQRIAYVPQRETVDWDFPITVGELVLMGRYGRLGLFRPPRKAHWAAVRHYLGLVEMEGFIDRQISQLSQGQQQRVFLARALMQEADFYLMDEPLAGIDLATEKVIMNLLKKLKRNGKTVVVVHHDLHSVESYFDWLIIVNMRLVACGETKTVFTSENLAAAYGRSYALLDEALKLSQSKTAGIA